MQGETETNRTQQIEDLCDPCTRFFVNKKLDTITDGKASDEYKEFARFVESLPAVCAKNANGQRCGLLADENAAGTSPLTAIGKPLFTSYGCLPASAVIAHISYLSMCRQRL